MAGEKTSSDRAPDLAPDLAGSVIVRLAGVDPDGPAAQALKARANIVGLSDASHDAVLTPANPGGVSHGLRAALAVRMARHNGDAAMAAHYGVLLDSAQPDLAQPDSSQPDPSRPERAVQAIADPSHMPSADTWLSAITRHVDMLATAPRDATKEDIQTLRDAGVDEPDIVRLSELAAFISFQARFVAGLRLLECTR